MLCLRIVYFFLPPPDVREDFLQVCCEDLMGFLEVESPQIWGLLFRLAPEFSL